LFHIYKVCPSGGVNPLCGAMKLLREKVDGKVIMDLLKEYYFLVL